MRSLRLLGASCVAVCLVACSSAPAGSPNDASNADGGCTETDGGGSGSCTQFVSCADLTTPSVSFAKDVLPIFNMSCGIGGQQCHGDPSVSKHTAQPYLGQTGANDAAKVIAGIVGQSAAEDPQLNLVTASDVKKSYLMHKVDGDACLFATACNATGNPLFKNCGIQMPFNAGSLDQAKRDTIRRWIAQGAKND